MTDQPRFELLANVPASVMETPPLASALQSFENSIFLVGLGRFPAALTACGTAVESTVRAIRGYKATSSDDGLRATIEFAIQKKPNVRRAGLNEFRQARNDFTHHGFSPKDDERAVTLLFGVGYPLLSECLWEFHQFSLRESVINDLWNQVDIARKALKDLETSGITLPDGTRPKRVSGARALQHTVRTSFRNPLDDRWTDIDFGMPEHEFLARMKAKHIIENKWNFHTYARCPIPTCASTERFIGLDESMLENLSPISLFCFDCHFRLGVEDPILLKHLVGTLVKSLRPEILREYGLTR